MSGRSPRAGICPRPRVAPGTRVTVRPRRHQSRSGHGVVPAVGGSPAPALGRPARAGRHGRRSRGTQRVSYSVVPQHRGLYGIGPLTVDRTDAFGLSRRRVVLDGRDQLLVTPEVEDLRAPADATSGANIGSARSRQLLRSGEEYYTMRGYQEGDDLRRIHWPSVARTGELMIRQDEASRRAGGLSYLDSREATLGPGAAPRVRARGLVRGEHRRAVRTQRLHPAARRRRDADPSRERGGVPRRARRARGGPQPHIARAFTAIRLARPPAIRRWSSSAPRSPPQELPQLVRAGGGVRTEAGGADPSARPGARAGKPARPSWSRARPSHT